MAKQPQSVPKLRKRLRHMYRRYIAIRILINSVSKDEKAAYAQSIESVPKLKPSELSVWYTRVEKELRLHTERYGIVGSLDEMERITKAPAPADRFIYVAKWHLQTLFTRYEQVFPKFSVLPPHARVAIDTNGIRSNSTEVQYTSLEASLFEDMALLWNEAKKAADSADRSLKVDSKKIKRANALARAVVKAAFNLVEGYLNGIAFDVALTRETSDSEKEKIFEWDERAGRARPLSLRDKILQYPRLALATTHPPINEANCPELIKIVNAERKLRHALIHPTPRVHTHGEVFDYREATYIELTLNEVAELVDTVIALIRTIQRCIEDKFGNVDYWLYERDSEGLFPEQSFQ